MKILIDNALSPVLAKQLEEAGVDHSVRHGNQRRPERHAETLLSNLETIGADLIAGSVVVIEPSRIRVRSLPLVS